MLKLLLYTYTLRRATFSAEILHKACVPMGAMVYDRN